MFTWLFCHLTKFYWSKHAKIYDIKFDNIRMVQFDLRYVAGRHRTGLKIFYMKILIKGHKTPKMFIFNQIFLPYSNVLYLSRNCTNFGVLTTTWFLFQKRTNIVHVFNRSFFNSEIWKKYLCQVLVCYYYDPLRS